MVKGESLIEFRDLVDLIESHRFILHSLSECKNKYIQIR